MKYRATFQLRIISYGTLIIEADNVEAAEKLSEEMANEWNRLGGVPALHNDSMKWDAAQSNDYVSHGVDLAEETSVRDIAHDFISEVFHGQEMLNDSMVPTEESAEKLAAIARTFLSRLEGGN